MLADRIETFSVALDGNILLFRKILRSNGVCIKCIHPGMPLIARPAKQANDRLCGLTDRSSGDAKGGKKDALLWLKEKVFAAVRYGC